MAESVAFAVIQARQDDHDPMVLARGLAAAAGADHIAILDADATFDWADLHAMLAPLRADAADVVFGRRVPHRREPGAMPWHVAVANAVLGRVCGWLAGTTLHDIGPFKVVRGDAVACIDARDRTYGWPLEFALRAACTGLRVTEVDVAYRVRAGVSKVTGRPWATTKTAGRMLVVLARHAFILRPGSRERGATPAR